jgi:hypothetical protein
MKLMILGLAGVVVVGILAGCAPGREGNQPVGSGVKGVASPFAINTTGKHSLFSDERCTVITDVHEGVSNLLYTVSIEDPKGSLTKGPWPLRDGWFMVDEGPSLWVFDGDETVRVVKLASVDQMRGLDERTAKEFPEIMKNAPKLFLDRLPPTVQR